jgi:hypothetical protein
MFTSIIGRLLLGIALSALGALLQKPPPGPKAAQLSDFGIVRADEGSSPLAFGGTYINWAAHIVAYGDFKKAKIKKKQKKK